MFKMVLVLNKSLKMTPGKAASQTAHAAVSLYIKAKSNPRRYLLFFNEIDTWATLGQAKVVLKAVDDNNLNELEAKANEADLLSVKVHDAGLTQIPTGSFTCLGIFGKSEAVDSITGNLPLY